MPAPPSWKEQRTFIIINNKSTNHAWGIALLEYLTLVTNLNTFIYSTKIDENDIQNKYNLTKENEKYQN